MQKNNKYLFTLFGVGILILAGLFFTFRNGSQVKQAPQVAERVTPSSAQIKVFDLKVEKRVLITGDRVQKIWEILIFHV
jgi:hypothetical protein